MDFKIDNLIRKIVEPPLIAENESYLLKFAENREEILAAQKLRFNVFNLEQRRGLDSAARNEVDRDEFDEDALHLLVYSKGKPEPIGTYRAIGQPGNDPLRMYMSREYEVSGMERYLPMTVEVGRSCVDKDFRNGAVVALLWAGLSAITLRSGGRYLSGCVSLEDVQPAVAWALYESFRDDGLLSPDVVCSPRKEFDLRRPADSEIAAVRADRAILRNATPPLLKGYIHLGAKICGKPAFDYEFGSIDLPIIVDMWRMPDRYLKHFFPNVTFPED